MRRQLFVLLAAACCVRTAAAQAPGLPPLPEAARVAGTVQPAALPPLNPVPLPTQPAAEKPPAPNLPAPAVEDLVSFDVRAADLRWEDGRWQLIAGGTVLKDFGRQETEARLALRLLRDLHLTQMGRVGTPQPIMEYWLSDGKAPQGLVSGLKVVTLDTASLRAEQVQGQWCVRDSYRVLFNFGSHGDECQQALGTIQRHGFTQVGFVGRASPVMLVFLANPTPISGSPLHAQAAADTSLRSTVPPGGVRPDHGLTHASGTQPSNPPIGPAALPQGRQLGLPGSGAGDLTPLGDRVPTHWRQVQLRQEGKDWKLVLGGYTLASFGPSERDARTALAAVQFYRFTDQYLVGHPKPAFSYFLVNGQAPHGLMFGLNTTAFRSESLTVQHTDDGWMVGEGIRPLLAFGDKEEEAKTALQAIQRFHFDTLCRIGSDDSAGMTFLVRSR